MSCRITISTRRLAARESGSIFSFKGLLSAKPLTINRLESSTPSLNSACATLTARALESSQFERKRAVEIAISSEWPWTWILPGLSINTSRTSSSTWLNPGCKLAEPEAKEPCSLILTVISRPCVSISTSPFAICSDKAFANSTASSRVCKTNLSNCWRSASVLSSSADSLRRVESTGKFFNAWSTLCCVTVLITVGSVRPGLNSCAIILVPKGIWSASTTRWTPKAMRIEPANCLNLMAQISAKESNNTKKHINNAIRSAKVPV